MNGKFIGEFELKERNVIISDPCYELGALGQEELSNVKQGTWKVFIKTKIVSGKEKVAELIAINDEIEEPLDDLKRKWRKMFTIDVDSGQAGFFQKNIYRKDNSSLNLPVSPDIKIVADGDRWYSVCCNITLSEQKAGILEGGAVSSSGFGDGGYPFYAIKRKGQVVGMRLVFIR